MSLTPTNRPLGPQPEVLATTTHDLVPTTSGLLLCTACTATFRPPVPGANFVWATSPETVGPCPGTELVEYRCLSMLQPWGTLVAEGLKTIETRTWATKHRGDLLLVASKKFDRLDWLPREVPFVSVHHKRARMQGTQSPDDTLGVALCLVNVVDCRPMRPSDERAAMCPCEPGKWAWVLRDIRAVKPVAVKGALQVFRAKLPRLVPA